MDLIALLKQQHDVDNLNKRNAERFERIWHKELCLIPFKLTNGKWCLPFQFYLCRRKAIKKKFTKISHNGVIEVYDPWKHYIYYEYEAGAIIEARKVDDKENK